MIRPYGTERGVQDFSRGKESPGICYLAIEDLSNVDVGLYSPLRDKTRMYTTSGFLLGDLKFL